MLEAADAALDAVSQRRQRARSTTSRALAAAAHWDHLVTAARASAQARMRLASSPFVAEQRRRRRQVVAHHQIEAAVIGGLAERDVDPHRQASGVDPKVDLGREASSRTAKTLARQSLHPLFRRLPAGALMRPHDRTVHHLQPVGWRVGVARSLVQCLQDRLPQPGDASSAGTGGRRSTTGRTHRAGRARRCLSARSQNTSVEHAAMVGVATSRRRVGPHKGTARRRPTRASFITPRAIASPYRSITHPRENDGQFLSTQPRRLRRISALHRQQ